MKSYFSEQRKIKRRRSYMERTIRYQGAIIADDGRMLLIQHREHGTGRAYWLLPGGGREDDESEVECVRREMREETCLDVVVERLLLDDAGIPGDFYQRVKTFLCRPVTGTAQPGYEPEPEAAAAYAIVAVGWWDLHDEGTWNPHIVADPLTSSVLRRIRAALVSS